MSKQSLALLTLTVLSTGAIAANRFVTPTGGQAGAAANAIGVSEAPATAAGERVPVTTQRHRIS